MEYAILYAYHESDASKIVLKHFLERSLSIKANYFFLLNEPNDTLTVLSQQYSNIFIRHYPDTNTAWQKWALIIDEISGKYQHYIFIKDKMMGPFLTPQQQEQVAKDDNNWMSLFVSSLNDNNIVISPVINPVVKHQHNTCKPHLQVNCWATHDSGLHFLLSHNFFRYKIRKREYYLLELLQKYPNVKGLCYYKPLQHLQFTHITTNFRKECVKQLKYDCPICKEKDILRILPEELMFAHQGNVHLQSFLISKKKQK